MSILNALVGAVTGGQAANSGMAQIASIAIKNPQILQVAASMLSADNKHGGLAGLMGKFQEAGLGDVAQSWVSTDENQPVQPQHLTQALGPDAMARIAAKAGVSPTEAPTLLAQILPVLVNQMTPKGTAPAQAPVSADALLGMLGGVLGKR